jgi:hypothetical protein
MSRLVLLATLVIVPGALGAQGVRIAPPAPNRLTVVEHAPTGAVRHLALRATKPGRLVIGGVLGALAGLATCYLISEAIAEAEDSTHCTRDGNLLFGVGGAALGVLVAAITD